MCRVRYPYEGVVESHLDSSTWGRFFEVCFVFVGKGWSAMQERQSNLRSWMYGGGDPRCSKGGLAVKICREEREEVVAGEVASGLSSELLKHGTGIMTLGSPTNVIAGAPTIPARAALSENRPPVDCSHMQMTVIRRLHCCPNLSRTESLSR